jgi:hypothetical protein
MCTHILLDVLRPLLEPSPGFLGFLDQTYFWCLHSSFGGVGANDIEHWCDPFRHLSVGVLPSFSLLDEYLAFAIKGFLLLHELVALLGPRLNIFCTSLVLELQVIAVFLHLLKVHFGIFFTTARHHIDKNLMPQTSMKATTMMRNTYSLDP